MAPSPGPGDVASAYAINATPIGPITASPHRGRRGPTASSATNITSTTATGTTANLGSPGRNPSIKPSSAAAPAIADAVYAISRRFNRMSSSDETTAEISGRGAGIRNLDLRSSADVPGGIRAGSQ